MNLSFGSPWWLLLAVIVPFYLLTWRRFTRTSRLPRVHRLLPYLRAATLLALIMLLADATWWRPIPGVTLHVLYDRSLSLPPAEQGKAETIARALEAARGGDDRVIHYFFGRHTLLVGSGPGGPGFADVTGAVGPEETYIEDAIRLVLSQADEALNHRILLVSDGFETAGRAEDAALEAVAQRVPIDVFPTDRSTSAEVLVERLIVPPSVSSGEPYRLQAVISSTVAQEARLRLYRNGLLALDQAVFLEEGRNLLALTGLLEEESDPHGTVTLELRVDALFDGIPHNNVDYGVITKEGTPEILIIPRDEAEGALLSEALRQQGLRATAVPPVAAPLDAATLARLRAVILVDLPADQLSLGQQSALAEYVQRGGGGLLAIGGPHSFGLGGYRRTVLEEILPVSADVPQDVIMPSLAMVLLIDRSGSMAETQGNFSKLDLAKEAALGVLDLMNAKDALGLIAFDSEAHWVVPLQSIENRVAIGGRIASLQAEGGTNLAAALGLARPELALIDASVKHLIALTDGRSIPGDFELLTGHLREIGVTVSTVGIGRDADRELLGQIAAWGDGRFYYTEDIRAIPQIFATETTVVTRPIRSDLPFQPEWVQPAEFWDDESAPPLGGYVMSSPKSTATVYLQAPDQSPILAAWRHGLGRSAALLANVAGPWAGEWTTWERFPELMAQLTRWLMSPAPPTGLFAHAQYADGTGSLTVDAIDPEGRYINFLNLTAEVLAPDGSRAEIPLTQVEAGRYAATFPAPQQGAYTIYVHEASSDAAPISTGMVVPYPKEYRVLSPDTGLLQRLARATGGEIVSDPAQLASLFVHPQPATARTPLAPLMLAIAFTLFLADIVIRFAPTRWSDRSLFAEEAREPDRTSAGEALRQKLEEEALKVEPREPQSRSAAADSARTSAAGRFLAQRKKR